jgi:hypothetical protein
MILNILPPGLIIHTSDIPEEHSHEIGEEGPLFDLVHRLGQGGCTWLLLDVGLALDLASFQSGFGSVI